MNRSVPSWSASMRPTALRVVISAALTVDSVQEVHDVEVLDQGVGDLDEEVGQTAGTDHQCITLSRTPDMPDAGSRSRFTLVLSRGRNRSPARISRATSIRAGRGERVGPHQGERLREVDSRIHRTMPWAW